MSYLPPNINATRRVPLRFKDDGTPYFPSTQSPTSFKQRALCVAPPHTVIPIIFVPGIMGTNLKAKASKKKVWTPPNGLEQGLIEVKNRLKQSPKLRQIELDPDNTEVDYDGPCMVPATFPWLDAKEAKRRGWGALHADSYADTLKELELTLNDQYTLPGRQKEQGNHLRLELGLLTELGAADWYSQAPKGQPNYKKAASDATRSWGVSPAPLSDDQIKRLEHYYYPVWAHGYNWLQSNEQSAQKLVEKIDEVLAFYEKNPYFHCDGKVIIVTHSMGGLVARRAAQLAGSKILGVVHGVQPVAGAPVVYRRFRAGTEVGGMFDIQGAASAVVLGWSAKDTTPSLATAPGPLELLPTKHYPPGWLKATTPKGGPAMPPLPVSDPYSEIYSKTTDDCWWGMVDPALIDPAGKIKSPLKSFKKALITACVFHDTLSLYAHPETYGYFGVDEDKHRTFGSVNWEASKPLTSGMSEHIENRKANWSSPLGMVQIPEDSAHKVCFSLSNKRDQGGDGTVPMASGAVLAKLSVKPKAVFKISGFDHQMSYKNMYAYQATIYGVARLVQLAKPAQP